MYLVFFEWLFLVVVVVSVLIIFGCSVCYRWLSLVFSCLKLVCVMMVVDDGVGGC